MLYASEGIFLDVVHFVVYLKIIYEIATFKFLIQIALLRGDHVSRLGRQSSDDHGRSGTNTIKTSWTELRNAY